MAAHAIGQGDNAPMLVTEDVVFVACADLPDMGLQGHPPLKTRIAHRGDAGGKTPARRKCSGNRHIASIT
jgi:hypothetical protein